MKPGMARALVDTFLTLHSFDARVPRKTPGRVPTVPISRIMQLWGPYCTLGHLFMEAPVCGNLCLHVSHVPVRFIVVGPTRAILRDKSRGPSMYWGYMGIMETKMETTIRLGAGGE